VSEGATHEHELFEVFVSPMASEGVVQEGLDKLTSVEVVWDEMLL
jgi:hypothetical protein